MDVKMDVRRGHGRVIVAPVSAVTEIGLRAAVVRPREAGGRAGGAHRLGRAHLPRG
jgi:hypothetical protein